MNFNTNNLDNNHDGENRPCAYDYGDSSATANYNPNQICPGNFPKCANYKKDVRWGTCINPVSDSTRTNLVDLETLKIEYENTLTEYRKTQKEYLDAIQERDDQPCGSYDGNSGSISQACYEDIWAKSGCTTQAGTLSTWNNWTSWTLNDLISNSWGWAVGINGSTNGSALDYEQSQQVCYGNYIQAFTLVGIGIEGGEKRPGYTCGNLWVWDLNDGWNVISDNSAELGYMMNINYGFNGIVITGIQATTGYIYYKTDLYGDWLPWDMAGGFVLSAQMLPNGNILALGMGYEYGTTLWLQTQQGVEWKEVSPPNTSVRNITLAPNGEIWCCAGINPFQIWSLNYMFDTENQEWTQRTGDWAVFCDITISPNGIVIGAGTNAGTYGYMYTPGQSYDQINMNGDTSWWNQINASNGAGSEWVSSVAAIPNPNYMKSRNTSMMPNLSAPQDIQSADACSAAGGDGYNYCPITGVHYCCGVCGGESLCEENGNLRSCACTKSNLTNQSLSTANNKKYMSSNVSKSISNSTANDCRAACAEDINCKAASFNKSNKQCDIYHDSNGKLIGNENYTSFVTTSLLFMDKLEQLNKKLNNINGQMTRLIDNKMDPEYKQIKLNSGISIAQLDANKKQLEEERKKIEIKQNELQSIEQNIETQNYDIYTNYYSYILLFIIALVCILITISISHMSGSGSSNSPILQGGGMFKNVKW
jgi:hypothetical protein